MSWARNPLRSGCFRPGAGLPAEIRDTHVRFGLLHTISSIRVNSVRKASACMKDCRSNPGRRPHHPEVGQIVPASMREHDHSNDPGEKAEDLEMQRIVQEEERVLARVLRHLASRSLQAAGRVDYDDELVALRDQIGEARLEDVPALIAHMERLQAVAVRRAEVSVGQVDMRSPYFGRIVLGEGDRKREVLIGRATYLDPRTGVHIVDWRDAPVSRVYYCYDEGDDYEEVFGTRAVEGEVLTRRSLAIADGVLRRIGTSQGMFVRDSSGRWLRARFGAARLQGGQGAALRPEQHHAPGKLGLGIDAEGREDKHLQEIAALIDPRQFELITRPESGLVVIQGGAGSGKTTVGLHRMAFLAYQNPERFRPEGMLVVTFNQALARYVSHVLPALGVPGVSVTTFQQWARRRRAQCVPRLPGACTDDTPATVVRLKKHPAMLRMVDDWVSALERQFEKQLREALRGLAGGQVALEAWQRASRKALAQRLAYLSQWAKGDEEADQANGPSLAVRHAVEREVGRARGASLDVANIWSELLTHREGIARGFQTHAPGEVGKAELDTFYEWCVSRCGAVLAEIEDREGGGPRHREEPAGDPEVGVDGEREHRPAELDWEDNALLLRIAQRVLGGIRRGKQLLQYQHVFVDEAQDLSPVELAVVLDTVSSRSVTVAGDVAQRVLMDNSFTSWSQVLSDLQLSHVALEPLKVSYRSTRPIMEFAKHVLGSAADDTEDDPVVREGVPVELFRFAHTGDAVGFLAEALRALAQAEPRSSVAVLARYAEQADLYYDGLANAEVPNLRRVAEQDFLFKAGVDVTDVRQVKGLEFDYVILVEVSPESYGVDDEARHLLHIAATRAAHQLWVTVAGTPSLLLPDAMRQRGY